MALGMKMERTRRLHRESFAVMSFRGAIRMGGAYN